MTIGAVIAPGQLGSLIYVPGVGFTGTDGFFWNATDQYDNTSNYAVSVASVVIEVGG